MRTTVVALMFVALVAAACSDRVPAPATPTPSPRPGYPPAPVSELPEGVLYVQGPTTESKVFRMHREEDAEAVGAPVVWPVSPERSRAVALTYGDRGVVLEIGILTGGGYEPIAEGEVIPSSPAFVWSKDGKRLGYTVPRDPASTQVEVWAFDAETSEKRLLSPEPGDLWLAGWTAAGDVLVTTPEGLQLLGERVRSIPLPEDGGAMATAVSPDGLSVAVRVGDWQQDEATGLVLLHGGGVWVLDMRRGTWRELVDFDGTTPVPQSTSGEELVWSPDGRRLAYQRDATGENTVISWETHVVDVLTGDDRLLANSYALAQAWSADGRWLAFMRWRVGFPTNDADRRLSIWDTDGRMRDVEVYVRAFAWAKNGRLLVDIPSHLSLLDPETMRVEDVVTGDGNSLGGLVEGAVWSPSGRYAALATPSDAYNRSSLYIIDTEEGTAEVFLDKAGFSAVAWLSE